MGICQIIYIVLLAMGLGAALIKHGEPRNEKYSFWGTLFATIVDAALLYFGGFFG